MPRSSAYRYFTDVALKDEGIFISQASGAACLIRGAKNTDEVIITESVIDGAALWSAGLRNVIPYGVTGLTEEIIAHLVESRVKRVVLLLNVDEAGRAAAIDMTQRLAAVNIEARSVGLPAKDAAEFIAGGGLVDELRMLITESAARALRAEGAGGCALRKATVKRGPSLFRDAAKEGDDAMAFSMPRRFPAACAGATVHPVSYVPKQDEPDFERPYQISVRWDG